MAASAITTDPGQTLPLVVPGGGGGCKKAKGGEEEAVGRSWKREERGVEVRLERGVKRD